MWGDTFSILGFEFHTFPFFVSLAFGGATLFLYLYERPNGVTIPKLVALLAGLSISFAFGCQLFSAIELNKPLYKAFSGGLEFTHLGGYVLGLITLILLGKLFKLPLLPFLDTLTLMWCIGTAIGRFACFFSGDGCYGLPTSLPWGMSFPHGLEPTLLKVHPTPLYESLYSIIIFLSLFPLYRRSRIDSRIAGKVFIYGMIAMLGSRFLVEFIRINPKYAGLSFSQWISLALISIYGMVWIFYIKNRFKKNERLAVNHGEMKRWHSSITPFNSRRISLLASIALLILLGGSVAYYGVMKHTSESNPRIFLEEDTLNMGSVQQGDIVHRSLLIRNDGGSPLMIREVIPSCGCTIAHLVDSMVAPGLSTSLDLTFDATNKGLGKVTKNVTIVSNSAENSEKKVILIGQIIPMKQTHREVMSINGVFQGKCAVCHVDRGASKQGQLLYFADCAICHDSPTPPEGAKKLIPRSPALASKEKMEEVIRFGLRNSNMPGFDSTKGGPLSKEQIRSLLDFLEPEVSP